MALYTARIGVWQRLDPAGQVETVPYDALTLYQRWQHGGAWMSIETGAIWLNQLLLGGGLPLVIVRDGVSVGYAEIYTGNEPDPYGAHLYLGGAILPDADAIQPLLDALAARAQQHKVRHILIARTGDETLQALEKRGRARTLACLRRYTIPARQGQVFYRAVESPDADPKRIAGWSMPVGRYTSARAQWETLWTHLWDALPPSGGTPRRHRLQLTAAGQEALVCVQQAQYDPRAAEVFAWTPKVITPQIVAALRDWGHREGYRTLTFTLEDDAAAILGAEAEGDGFHQETCALALG
jgi:hypothetical protein